MKVSEFLNQYIVVTSGIIEGFVINVRIDSTSGAIVIPLRCVHFYSNRVLAVKLDSY